MFPGRVRGVGMAKGTGRPVDRTWLSGQIKLYKELQSRYQLYAAWLYSVLNKAAKNICAAPIVQTRSKELASFAGKCVRQWPGAEKKTLINEFTDLAGGRIIVQLLREVYESAGWIRRHFRIDELNSEDKRDQLEPDEFGYLSVHLIVSIDPLKLPEGICSGDLLVFEDNKPVGITEPIKAPARLTKKRLGLLKDKIRRTGPYLDHELWAHLSGLRSEVQLRTMVQHAWSDVGHDWIYKSKFQVPADYERQNAKIAALLEEVDEAFTDLVDGVSQLKTNVGAYHDHDATCAEIDRLKATLEHDKKNTTLVEELARRQISIGLYSDAIAMIEDHYPQGGCCIELDVCIGRARCLWGRLEDDEVQLKNGRLILKCVLQHRPDWLEAATFLAESYVGYKNREDALHWFGYAFGIDPNDPAALGGYLRHRIADDKDPTFSAIVQPNIEAAIERCQAQIDVSVNLPYALYRIAEFHLLSCPPQQINVGYDEEDEDNCAGLPTAPRRADEDKQRQSAYEGLYALCRAISLTTDLTVLKAEHAKMKMLHRQPKTRSECITWAKATLELAIAYHPNNRRGKPPMPRQIGDINTNDRVLIIAGGCDEYESIAVKEHRDILEAVVEEFAQTTPSGRRGIVMGGGTLQGISGVVGELCDARRDRLRAVAYIPKPIPDSAEKSPHYELLDSGGESQFTPTEPLYAWSDLLSCGIRARDVRLVGVNGGRIAAFEYHLAAALAAIDSLPPSDPKAAKDAVHVEPGGQVAVIRKSGRFADRLMLAEDAPGNECIRFLPADVESFRAFINFRPERDTAFEDDEMETMKKACNGVYNETVNEIEEEKRKARIAKNPSLQKAFDDSTREQVRHIESKLARLGKHAVRVEGDARINEFSKEQIELLAEMEHGRWVAERTRCGWTLGDKRDDQKHIRPQLISWLDLKDDERRKDKRHAEEIPRILAEIGFEIQDLPNEEEGSDSSV